MRATQTNQLDICRMLCLRRLPSSTSSDHSQGLTRGTYHRHKNLLSALSCPAIILYFTLLIS
jgi:hypothetical protein